MIWIDIKYAQQLSIHFERFVVKTNNPYLANARCVLCGDSKKNKSKMRGYFFAKPGGVFYTCHNCQWSGHISKLLKLVDNALFEQYKMEILKEKKSAAGHEEDTPPEPSHNFKPTFRVKSEVEKFYSAFPNIRCLPTDHVARVWCENRKIPVDRWGDIRYAKDVRTLGDILPEYKTRLKVAEPRILFPFVNRAGELLGITGRSMAAGAVSSMKYMTLKFDPDAHLIFGEDKINISSKVYLVEGPIDSMFVPNGVAANGTAFNYACEHFDDVVVVPDNQPRNTEVVNIIKRSIDSGRNVFIWPLHVEDKDINDFVLRTGASPQDIKQLIDNNTFNGMKAQIVFNSWKKC